MVFAIHQHEPATGAHVPPDPNHPHPPPPILLGCPRALALTAQLCAFNLHWSSILHMVIYMFQCSETFVFGMLHCQQKFELSSMTLSLTSNSIFLVAEFSVILKIYVALFLI